MNYYTNIQNIGNNILFRGIDNGRRVASKVPFKPSLYVKNNRKKIESKWKSLEGFQLEELKFDKIYEAREFIKKYHNVQNYPIYGQTTFQYAYISTFYGHKIQFDTSDIVIATIDIEVGSDNGFPEPSHANEQITAITLHIQNKFKKETENGFYYVFGCHDYNNTRTDTRYYKCTDEQDLILKFIDLWEQHYPDIVTGWNVLGFDFPYIINRMKRIFMEEQIMRLSPWGRVQDREVLDDKFGKKKIQIYEMLGISILDYIKLYKKFAKSPNQESYKLDHIAFVELKEKKLAYVGSLHNLYLNDFQKFIDYNIKDVTLVINLNKKLKLLELAMTLAYQNKVNFSDVLSPVRMWDSITVTHLLNKDIIVPPKKEHVKTEFPGGFVKEPKPGKYRWVVSLDLDGLYPHLIMMCNLGPETLVNPKNLGEEFMEWWNENEPKISVDSLLNKEIDTSILKKYNVCLTPNKQLFKCDKQGFFAELMESMYADRKSYKDQMLARKNELEHGGDKEVLENEIAMLDNFQASKKVILNAAYGAIANEWFRFFDVRVASAVTMSGQLAIQWIQREMNAYLNKLSDTTDVDFIIASDTDSMYLNLEPLIENSQDTKKVIRAMDKFCENILQKFINETYNRLYDYINAFAPKMSMKREALCDMAIWTGKKHYILNVWNQEGVEYEKPKMKIVGLQAVMAGSLSTEAREKIKKAYEFIINDDREGLNKLRDEYKKEFNRLDVEKIALPKTCNGIKDYYDKETRWKIKTPFHTKGALIYNDLIGKMKLEKQYPKIKEGEKVKYTYIKEPNFVQSNVISFPEILPPEFDLHKIVDYNTQFEKAFINPVELVMNAIGWKFEDENSLDRFFS